MTTHVIQECLLQNFYVRFCKIWNKSYCNKTAFTNYLTGASYKPNWPISLSVKLTPTINKHRASKETVLITYTPALILVDTVITHSE